jgi:lipopolysaccharide biosynthesis regulator YciM
MVLNDLAAACWSARQYERSVPLFEETLRLRIKALGQDDAETIRTAFNLAANYRDAGRADEAVQLVDKWIGRASAVLAPAHEVRGLGRDVGAQTYTRAGLHDRAEPLLREAAELTRQSGAASAAHAEGLAALGLNLLQQRKWVDAEPVLRECLVNSEREQPDAWATFNRQSLLGGALLGQKRYADAEPLLLRGYEGMKQRESQIPEQDRSLRLSEAAGRLCEMYDAWDKPADAAKWRHLKESAGAAKDAAADRPTTRPK